MTPSVNLHRLYPRGIAVKSVHTKSPGHFGGLKRGDIIVNIDGVDIDDINTYYLLISGSKPNATISYTVYRPLKAPGRGGRSRRRRIGPNNSNQSNYHARRRSLLKYFCPPPSLFFCILATNNKTQVASKASEWRGQF